MRLTNSEIYSCAQELITEFGPDCQIQLPVRINFFLQKNIRTMKELAEDIENTRLTIARTYGVLNQEQNVYEIPNEKLEAATKELNELFSLEQEVSIHIFKLSDFDGVETSYKQLSALMFMIEED